MKNLNFFEIKSKSKILNDLVSIKDNNDPFVDYFNFEVKFVSPDVTNKDPFLRALNKSHRFNAAILRINQNSIYNWHIDDNRGVSVNMLIDGGASHCIFTNEEYAVVNNIQELKYEPKTYYALNVQNYHSVINFEKPRYMFSLEFNEDKNILTFDQLIREMHG